MQRRCFEIHPLGNRQNHFVHFLNKVASGICQNDAQMIAVVQNQPAKAAVHFVQSLRKMASVILSI